MFKRLILLFWTVTLTNTLFCARNNPLNVPQLSGIPNSKVVIGSFQDASLSGTMAGASTSLKTVEENAVSGCPGGLDCIPQYSFPDFISLANASYMRDDDLVAGVSINGAARAYPHSTLWSHEIANDTVGGVLLAVNHCPLTGTSLNFKGEIDGQLATFGVSGQLYNNNLILYDHQTQSFWPQMLFTAAWGPKKGRQIHLLPVYEMTWKAWKKLFPQSTVVASQYARGYYPYGDYYTSGGGLFPQDIDSRLLPKDLVMGVIGSKTARAYPFKHLGAEAVINDDLDNDQILVVFHEESKLSIVYVRPQINGKVIEFEKADPAQVFPFDIKSKNGDGVWSFLGKGISGAAVGNDLEQVTTAFKGFWLSWGTYYKGIDIYK